jgi:hypothetical protein
MDIRHEVSEGELRTGRTAWEAFTSPDPRLIERFLASDTSALPFLSRALRSHLEEFPSVENDLSYVEMLSLTLLRKHGLLRGAYLYVHALEAETERQMYIGDGSFFEMIAALATARNPLVRVSKLKHVGAAEVELTDVGREVLEDRADHIQLNGIDRWLGGVHLEGANAAWRWDRARGTIVAG